MALFKKGLNCLMAAEPLRGTIYFSSPLKVPRSTWYLFDRIRKDERPIKPVRMKESVLSFTTPLMQVAKIIGVRPAYPPTVSLSGYDGTAESIIYFWEKADLN